MVAWQIDKTTFDCTISYMTKRMKNYKSMTDALLAAIEDCELSYKALEAETGVTRQSLMGFAKGERTLRLDMADKLAAHFGLEVVRRKTAKRKAK